MNTIMIISQPFKRHLNPINKAQTLVKIWLQYSNNSSKLPNSKINPNELITAFNNIPDRGSPPATNANTICNSNL